MNVSMMSKEHTDAVRIHRGRLKFVGGIVLTLLLAWLVHGVLSWRPYQASLGPAPGYQMVNLTEPGGVVGSVRKTAQIVVEQTPCDYTLLGWTDTGVLYYRAACGNNRGFWSVDPAASSQPMWESSAPLDLQSGDLTRASALTWVTAPGVRPVKYEPYSRDLNLRDYTLSPDGKWLAVVSRHVYGPEDVLLVSRK